MYTHGPRGSAEESADSVKRSTACSLGIPPSFVRHETQHLHLKGDLLRLPGTMILAILDLSRAFFCGAKTTSFPSLFWRSREFNSSFYASFRLKTTVSFGAALIRRRGKNALNPLDKASARSVPPSPRTQNAPSVEQAPLRRLAARRREGLWLKYTQSSARAARRKRVSTSAHVGSASARGVGPRATVAPRSPVRGDDAHAALLEGFAREFPNSHISLALILGNCDGSQPFEYSIEIGVLRGREADYAVQRWGL